MSQVQDTIVAVSSAPGRSFRGLVRLSGPDTPKVMAQLLARPGDGCASGPDAIPCPGPLPARQLTACRVQLPTGSLPALLAMFHAPASYTGQAMAELQLPGNPALLDRVVHQAMAGGARLAEPGEFTFRAFLAGKLDLTQAEGVAATIAATSDAQLQAATLLRQGKLGGLAHSLVDQLADALALVEAGIDFTDQEDVVPIGPAALDQRLSAIQTSLHDLLAHSRGWAALDALPRAVLAGLPSTGKSTLFNALLGRPRAVVSATPGTTRDVLTEPLRLTGPAGEPVEVLLIDIAGLDTPGGALDHAVQAAARDAIRQADLVIAISDTDQPAAVQADDVIHVRTKADLAGGVLQAANSGQRGFDLAVSATAGEGLDDLRQLIAQRVGGRAVSVGGQLLALQPRHESSLQAAADHIEQTRALLTDQLAQPHLDHVELIAGAMRAALDDLAGLGGQMTPDDVIGRIFATFCVGK